MQVNEKLTEAARRGARGAVEAGAFQSLPDDKQQALIEQIMGDSALTSEIVRASLLATRAEDLEDLLNSMGDTLDPDGKAAQQGQHLHRG